MRETPHYKFQNILIQCGGGGYISASLHTLPIKSGHGLSDLKVLSGLDAEGRC